MKISRSHTGVFSIILSPTERQFSDGPYRVGIFNSKAIELCTVATGSGGLHGTRSGESWVIATRGSAVEKHFPNAFGPTDVKAIFEKETKCFKITVPATFAPARRPRKDIGAPRKDLVSHGLEVAHLKAEPMRRVEPIAAASHHIPLAELVRIINARRTESQGNMVFSIDAEGYLRVMVEYGR